MVRIVHATITTTPERQLTPAQALTAERRIARSTAKNPLRRVHLACEERAVRDAVARLGDHVWCEKHAEFARVVRVVE